MIHGIRNGLGWLGAFHRAIDWHPVASQSRTSRLKRFIGLFRMARLSKFDHDT